VLDKHVQEAHLHVADLGEFVAHLLRDEVEAARPGIEGQDTLDPVHVSSMG
jgi:hypothetical protein